MPIDKSQQQHQQHTTGGGENRLHQGVNPQQGSQWGGGGPAHNPTNPTVSTRVRTSTLSKCESRIPSTADATPWITTSVFWTTGTPQTTAIVLGTTGATTTVRGTPTGDDDVVIPPPNPSNTTRNGNAAVPPVLPTTYGRLSYAPVSTAKHHGWVLSSPTILEPALGHGGGQ